MSDLYIAVSVPIRLIGSHSLSLPGFKAVREGFFASFPPDAPPEAEDFVRRFSAGGITVLGAELSVFEVGEPASSWQKLRVSFSEARSAEAIKAFLRSLADVLTVALVPEQMDPWYGNLVVEIDWTGMRPEEMPSSDLNSPSEVSMAMEYHHRFALTAELLEALATSDRTEIFADGMRANQPKAKYANWFIPLEDLEDLARSDFKHLFTPLFPQPVREAVVKDVKEGGLIEPALGRLQSYLGKPELTVENREEKLYAILKEIGLTDFSVAQTRVTVDLKLCERLIRTRNRLAHKGTRVEEDLLYNVLYPLSFRVIAYLNARPKRPRRRRADRKPIR